MLTFYGRRMCNNLLTAEEQNKHRDFATSQLFPSLPQCRRAEQTRNEISQQVGFFGFDLDECGLCQGER
jgi:hypothetical protein